MNHYEINTLRFEDDQARIADSEDNYRERIHIKKRSKHFGMDNKCLQRIYRLWGFLCKWKNIQQKLAKFVQLLGILNDTFKPTLNPESF